MRQEEAIDENSSIELIANHRTTMNSSRKNHAMMNDSKTNKKNSKGKTTKPKERRRKEQENNKAYRKHQQSPAKKIQTTNKCLLTEKKELKTLNHPLWHLPALALRTLDLLPRIARNGYNALLLMGLLECKALTLHAQRNGGVGQRGLESVGGMVVLICFDACFGLFGWFLVNLLVGTSFLFYPILFVR